MQEIENNTALTKSDAATPEILPAESAATSESLQKAVSESLSLIDDSAKHLLGLMQDIRESVEPGEGRKFMNPVVINAACNCAKNIQTLLKTKLETLRFQKGLVNK